MGRHVFFIFLYLALSNLLPSEAVGSILILHCVTNIIADLGKKMPLYVMTPFYVGVIITTLANILFTVKIGTMGLSEFSMYRYIERDYINDATQIWCIGNALMFIGYELFSKRSFAPIIVEIKSKKVLKNIYIFIIVFTILNISGYGFSLSFLGGGFEKVLSLLGVVGILFYARIWVSENNVTYRNYAITLTILQTFVALFSSFLRVELLTPSISLAAGYFIGKGSLKFLFTYRAIPIIGLIFLFSMFFQSLGGNRAHFIDSFTKAGREVDQVNSSYTYGDDEKQTGGAMERSSNLAQLTNVVKLVHDNGTYNGRASFPLLAAFIPRFIWPDKPIIQLGAWFALEIGAASIGESGRANNSINMTIPGELYLDFGWIGLFVGCLLFGGLLAAFWNAARFLESPYNLTGTLWGGYLLLYALGGIGADLQIVISLTSAYLVFLIIKKVTQRNENTRARAALEGQ